MAIGSTVCFRQLRMAFSSVLVPFQFGMTTLTVFVNERSLVGHPVPCLATTQVATIARNQRCSAKIGKSEKQLSFGNEFVVPSDFRIDESRCFSQH
jgi:hypothetical protein